MGAWNPQANDIFLDALEIAAPASRMAFIERACGGDAELRAQVDSLIAASQKAGSFLETPPSAIAGPASPTFDQAPLERPGTQIGPYKLLQQIGEGGMGTVYMAEQSQPVQRKVALKIIKPGMDSRQIIARFEAERQALAMMDHVNIARVLDAGATEGGRPYFVMELVRGVPITQYCDDNHLTPRERLELFVPVCQAIQHAHQKGIIHRDIKPSNVMVTLYDGKPVPKVIDFGVAKATEQKLTERTLFTQYGTLVGTLEYMSPEQAEMSALGVDTRSDIYSLGVLLYELLTGSTPLSGKRMKEAAYAEILRLIKEEEPPKPSTRLSESGEALASISAQRKTEPAKLSKLMRGELDWIVMKCLEKDRNRRYETASGFAQDVQRYLADEPVQACPPSAGYRFRKFARRNKAALTMALVLGLALLALVGGITGSVGWAVRDRTVRQTALEQEVHRALTEAETWYERGNVFEAMATVKRAEALLATADANPALQERGLRLRYELEIAGRLDEIRLLVENDQTATAQLASAACEKVFLELGIDIDGSAVEAAAVRIRERRIWKRLTTALDDLAGDRRNLVVGKVRTDAAFWQRPLEVARTVDADPYTQRLRLAIATDDGAALETLATAPNVDRLSAPTLRLLVRGLYWSGPPERRTMALRLLQDALTRQPNDFWLNFVLGNYLARSEPPRNQEALTYYFAARALRPQSHSMHERVGNLLSKLGRREEAIAAFRRALALKPDSVLAHNNLGAALKDQGKLEEAIACYRKAIEIDPQLAMAYHNLGIALTAKNDLAGAAAAYKQSVFLDPKNAVGFYNLGVTLAAVNDLPGAIAATRQAISLDPKDPKAHHNLGVALAAVNDLPGAIAAYKQAIALDPKAAAVYHGLGNAMMAQNDLPGAIAAYKQAIVLDPKHAPAHLNLGNALRIQNDLPGAIEATRQAIALDPKDAKAHTNLGLALGDQNDVAGEIAAHKQAIALDPMFALAHFNLGAALHHANRLDEAIPAYMEAIRLRPDYAKAHNNLGKAREAKNDRPGAIADYSKAIEFDPNDSMYLSNRASAFMSLSKWAEAAADCERIVDLEPQNGGALYTLANCHVQLARYQEALDDYRRLIERFPKVALAFNDWAWLLATCPDATLRNPGRAVELSLKAVELDPMNGDFHNTLGVAHYRAGEWKAGVLALRKSMELRDGGDASDWFFLAMAHWQLDEKDEARKWYDQAIAWTEKNAKDDEELRRVRTEADELMKLEK